jgi:hypothetical protein
VLEVEFPQTELYPPVPPPLLKLFAILGLAIVEQSFALESGPLEQKTNPAEVEQAMGLIGDEMHQYRLN